MVLPYKHGERSPILGFAHRGATLNKSEHNTLTAFERALTQGASGLESDIAVTADGVPVLAHPSLLGRGPSISRLERRDLPSHIPSLLDLYQRCGTDFELSLDMAQPLAAESVVRIAGDQGALNRLWLNYWRVPMLETWRERWPDLHLVYPTILLPWRDPQPALQRLAALHIDAVNVFHRLCTPTLVRQAHALDLRLFAWGIRSERPLKRVLAHGVDGVYCDDVQGMVEALTRTSNPSPLT